MQDARKIQVRFFGAAADLAGTRETEVASDTATLDTIWLLLEKKYPDLAPMRDTMAFAVNGEYARMDDRVQPGDEVAVLPPVSGG
ncbi:molybdopterin converting factor subunit 1 [soil metagenome]